jgi:hypothetical protein
MDDTPPEERLPPTLRLLKWLVIALTLTMIGGLITIVAVLVTRMPDASRKSPDWPASLSLPAGVVAEAVTRGTDWIGVVTKDGRILIFSLEGQLTHEIEINSAH